jgi:hypothetical protein
MGLQKMGDGTADCKGDRKGNEIKAYRTAQVGV